MRRGPKRKRNEAACFANSPFQSRVSHKAAPPPPHLVTFSKSIDVSAHFIFPLLFRRENKAPFTVDGVGGRRRMGRLIKPRLNQDSSRTRRSRSPPSPHVYWVSQTNLLRPHSQRPPIKAKGKRNGFQQSPRNCNICEPVHIR